MALAWAAGRWAKPCCREPPCLPGGHPPNARAPHARSLLCPRALGATSSGAVCPAQCSFACPPPPGKQALASRQLTPTYLHGL
jgi:hypothetical protein